MLATRASGSHSVPRTLARIPKTIPTRSSGAKRDTSSRRKRSWSSMLPLRTILFILQPLSLRIRLSRHRWAVCADGPVHQLQDDGWQGCGCPRRARRTSASPSRMYKAARPEHANHADSHPEHIQDGVSHVSLDDRAP